MSKVPSATVLVHAAKVALEHEMPIHLDYYADSLEKKVCIGVSDDGTKRLVRSETEYTSDIAEIKRIKEENAYIIMTENSIYIVSALIPAKKIATPA